MPLRKESGFTIIELLVTMALASALVGLAVVSLRHFWLVRSLEGGADQVVSQFRQLQEDAISESHPLVFGARFRPDSSNWELIRYDPTGGGSGTPSCFTSGTRAFDAGVKVSAVDFGTLPAEVSTACSLQTGEEIVLFYARGTASAGSVTLLHPGLSGRSRTITVIALTGRVTKS